MTRRHLHTGVLAGFGTISRSQFRRLKLAAATGIFTLTGQDVAFLKTFGLVASTGTFTLSGQAVAFVRELVMKADAGTFTVTGQAADSLLGKAIVADVGSFIVTGQDAGLVRSLNLQAETGVFTISGQAVSEAPKLVAAGTPSSGTGSVSLGMPTGIAAGDLLIVAIETFASEPVTLPVGWSHIGASPYNYASQHHLTLAWKLAGSSEGSFTASDPGDHWVGGVVAYRGVDQTSPIVTAASRQQGSSSPVTSQTLSGVPTNARVVLVIATGTDTASSQFSAPTNSSLSGIAQDLQQFTTSGNGGGVYIASGVAPVSGTIAAWSVTQATPDQSSNISFAIR